MKRTPLKPRSRKMQQIYAKRVPFVAEFLAENPSCVIKWDSQCFGRSQSVHEYIPRSKQGVIIPGEEAEAQGQIFYAACNYCNQMVSQETAEARRRGWLK
jgi:hypothetical protein